jgi:O-succinylbenzoate synthase
MKVERIILRYVRLPMRAAFENRWNRIVEWTKLLVEVQGDGGVGYGECMAMETPHYSYETIETAWWATTRWLADLVLNRSFEHPSEVATALNSIAGHHEAKAGLECACWDLFARAQSMPLYRLLGGSRRPVRAGATVGVESTIDAALEAAAAAADAGYERIRFKIKPGWDRALLNAARSALPAVTILADANGAYGEPDIAWLAELESLSPIMLEQPFQPSCWSSTARLQARTEVPVCLDESITCVEDVGQMITSGAGRAINLKVGRVGGLSAALRIHERCADAGIPVFIGSKSETGVGRWMNVAMATLSHVSLPSDISAGSRYFTTEIVRDPVVLCDAGMVMPLAGPGFGTELDAAAVLSRTVKTRAIPA